MSSLVAMVGVEADLLREERRGERATAARAAAESLRPVFTALHPDRSIPWTFGWDFRARVAIEFLQEAARRAVVVESRRRSLRESLEAQVGVVLSASMRERCGPSATENGPAIVDALVRYVESLVAEGFLGFVVYRGAGATGAYAYPLRRVTPRWWSWGRLWETVMVREDPQAPEGQRVTYQKIARAWGKAEFVTEAHVHHLREMSEAPLNDFRGWTAAPRRVRLLCREIPGVVGPFLRVITGKIIEEEVHVRDERTQWLTSTVIKTWKDSPAIVMGDVVLAGWSSDEVSAA